MDTSDPISAYTGLLRFLGSIFGTGVVILLVKESIVLTASTMALLAIWHSLPRVPGTLAWFRARALAAGNEAARHSMELASLRGRRDGLSRVSLELRRQIAWLEGNPMLCDRDTDPAGYPPSPADSGQPRA